MVGKTQTSLGIVLHHTVHAVSSEKSKFHVKTTSKHDCSIALLSFHIGPVENRESEKKLGPYGVATFCT